MNWRGGLIRLWLVASIFWLSIVGGFASYGSLLVPWLVGAQEKACADQRAKNPALGNPFDCFDTKPATQVPQVAKYSFIGIAPVLGTLLLGMGGAWVWAAFRGTDHGRGGQAQGGGAGGVIVDADWRPLSPNDLTRWGLSLNGVGAVLLLICHFPLTLPSGEPPG